MFGEFCWWLGTDGIRKSFFPRSGNTIISGVGTPRPPAHDSPSPASNVWPLIIYHALLHLGVGRGIGRRGRHYIALFLTLSLSSTGTRARPPARKEHRWQRRRINHGDENGCLAGRRPQPPGPFDGQHQAGRDGIGDVVGDRGGGRGGRASGREGGVCDTASCARGGCAADTAMGHGQHHGQCRPITPISTSPPHTHARTQKVSWPTQ